MIKFIKNIFKSGKNKSDSIHSITCGEQDEDGGFLVLKELPELVMP